MFSLPLHGPTHPHTLTLPCRPLFMYQKEFQFSLAAVCTHHLIFAAFHRDKRSVWDFGSRDSGIMRCPLVLFFVVVVLFWSLFWGSLSAHSASTRWPLSLFRSPQNLALLPAVYCKLQSHNLYFLKMKKYYQQYILSLFKSGFNGIWTILFFLPYLYVVVLVPNKMSLVQKYEHIV